MKFTVRQRLALLAALPQQGNLVTMRVMHELHMRLSFSEEEQERLKFVPMENGTIWNTIADVPVEIEIGEAARGIIVQGLKDMDARGRLTADHLPLWDIFVEGKK